MFPKLIRYFDTSYEVYVNEYLVHETEDRVYLCSPVTFHLAEELGKSSELNIINTRNLPKNWCKYTDVYDNKNFVYIPSIIQKNYNQILLLAEENFEFISRICDFFKEYSDSKVKRDFHGCCRGAWAITQNYTSRELLQNLFNIVFSSYEVELEQNKLQILMDTDLSEFLISYEDIS